MEIINATRHNISVLYCPDIDDDYCNRDCWDCIYANIIDIEPSGINVSAKPVEEYYKNENGIEFVTLEFVPNEENNRELKQLENKIDKTLDDDYIIIGSIIAAQAFPERVHAMIPVPTFERVSRDKKLVRSDKFTVYPKHREGEKCGCHKTQVD